MGLFKRFG